jgi:hypothetical protein
MSVAMILNLLELKPHCKKKNKVGASAIRNALELLRAMGVPMYKVRVFA